MHIQRAQLLSHPRHNVGIGMPYARHVVVHVDVLLAGIIVELHPLSAPYVNRGLVEEWRARAKCGVTPFHQSIYAQCGLLFA